MEIEYKKAKEKDISGINSLFDNWIEFDSTVKSRKLLFEKKWANSEDYFGIIAISGIKIIGFLGVFFSDRLIKNKKRKVASLTSFYILPEFRGQKLTYKMIQFLKTIDDYIIYALTPIPGTYNIYLSNGFKPLEKERMVYKKPVLKLFESSLVLNINPDLSNFSNELTDISQDILLDHQYFNCKEIICELEGKNISLIIKTEILSLGKLINKKWFFYLSKILGTFIRKNIAENQVKVDEVYYCSDYQVLNGNLTIFLKAYFKSKESSFISFRSDYFRSRIENKFLKYRIIKSDQFYYSKDDLLMEDLDLLYSELFVLS